MCDLELWAVPQATASWLCGLASINVVTALVTQAPSKLKEIQELVGKSRDPQTGAAYLPTPAQGRLLRCNVSLRVRTMVISTFSGIIATLLYGYLQKFAPPTPALWFCWVSVAGTWLSGLLPLTGILTAGNLLYRLADAQLSKP